MHLGSALDRISEGRLFIRQAAGVNRTPDWAREPARRTVADPAMQLGPALVLGVVAIRKEVDVERLHEVRLNSSFWMDGDKASRLRVHHPEMLPEFTANEILTQSQWASSILPDSFEVFVRDTGLKHQHRHLRWVYVMGMAPQLLTTAIKEGVYDIAGPEAELKLSDAVKPADYPGTVASCIFREPIWGPGCEYGFASSMEPTYFPRWLEAERARPQRSTEDPMFRAFVKKMEEAGLPELHIYTAAQAAERDAVTKRIVGELYAAQRVNELQRLAAMLGDGKPATETETPQAPRRMRP